MSFYKTNNVTAFTNGQSGSVANAWGILPAYGTTPTGTLTLQATTLGSTAFTSMSIAHLTPGQIFVCDMRSVSVSGGTVYVLA